MGKQVLRRGFAATAVLTALGGTALATAGVAGAMPTDEGQCNQEQVHVEVTQEAGGAMGHHADVLHYTAATPDVRCVMQGAPTATVFFDGGGAPLGVPTSQAAGTGDRQVTIDATHSACSYVIIADGDGPGPQVSGLSFALPSGGVDTVTQVAWPAPDLTGDVQFGAVEQA
ncbi:hypothetical protein FPZ12_023735 [Amycolatopsis acidicola]|uniref:DUF4232 domain-containing protein n=1 Tax=Amycolatopsis acidicola TaxID=2596893 RepID=A0A5N0V0S0_9PSEU|nr:hypothetical protein [Amycolatopsis acidicola]KAA9158117.1 hypothetical protein FPZ12_023735 [Amycolatopsis acidicola]